MSVFFSHDAFLDAVRRTGPRGEARSVHRLAKDESRQLPCLLACLLDDGHLCHRSVKVDRQAQTISRAALQHGMTK